MDEEEEEEGLGSEEEEEKEEERVSIREPPPLWTAYCGEEFANSYIFTDEFKAIEKDVGGGTSVESIHIKTSTNFEVPAVYFAASYGDVPFLAFLCRNGGNLNSRGPELNLKMSGVGFIVMFYRNMRHMVNTPLQKRQYMKTLEFLVTRGADLTLKDTTNLTALGQALGPHGANNPVDIDMCKLLLEYGADPNEINLIKH